MAVGGFEGEVVGGGDKDRYWDWFDIEMRVGDSEEGRFAGAEGVFRGVGTEVENHGREGTVEEPEGSGWE